jgi:hypothetical protein
MLKRLRSPRGSSNGRRNTCEPQGVQAPGVG